MKICILDIRNEETKRNAIGEFENWLRIKIQNRVSGPESVKNSLLRGLKQLHIAYEYNDMDPNSFSEVVIVMSGINNLKECILLKKKGYIQKLIAGPNLVTFSTEFNGILSAPEIDLCIVPSLSVKKSYEKDLESLKGRVYVWPAGVDESFWDIRSRLRLKTQNRVLVYQKNAPDKIFREVIKYFEKSNIKHELIEYGDYSIKQYKRILAKVDCAIFLSKVESQGIAMAEAWAMNVPTLVWKAKEVIIYGRKFLNPLSAPYLSKMTGNYWNQGTNFAKSFNLFMKRLKSFKPREWVMKNMTDKIVVDKLINRINQI